MRKKIIICGGHLTPAIAVFEALKKRHPDWEYMLVGRVKTFERSAVLSEEEQTANRYGLRFLPLDTGRWLGRLHIATLASLVRIPMGLVQAFRYISREKPDCIVSFGGYIAFPVAIAGAYYKIPILTHEQTRQPGRANAFISKIASRVCVSFADSTITGVRPSKVVITGLPIREEIFRPPSQAPIAAGQRFILVTGGATGSMSINTVIWEALPRLLREYSVVHIVGRNAESMVKEVAQKLQKSELHTYIPLIYTDVGTYSWLLHHAQLVIGRSGANTVAEIASVGQIALAIPLPWARDNEQYANAKYLVDAGSGLILEQKNLTSQTLIQSIQTMMEHAQSYRKQALLLKNEVRTQGAAERIAAVVEQIIR